MEKIPFKVSARTAKLIGQENFSNPEGATIELVKNSYDADAKNCLVVFDILFGEIPEEIDQEGYQIHSKGLNALSECYKLKSGKYFLKENLEQEQLNYLKSYFFSFNSIYIIDNGEGMTKSVIKDQWMEIGTGNKEVNYVSDDGRVKTGAKGIGRFALDRLGLVSEMWTKSKRISEKTGYYWRMDWKQFDVKDQSISDIKADLNDSNVPLKSTLEDRFKENNKLTIFLKGLNLKHGTIIKITSLKDSWTEDNLISVYKSLQALIPPKELQIPFSVNFYHLQNGKSFGEVETAYFNDFDYKVSSEYNAKDLTVKLTITRNELNLSKVKKDFKDIFKKAIAPYDLNTLTKKKFTITTSVHELMKWEETPQNKAALKNIGDFSFSFYFLKVQASQKENYPYKEVNAQERRSILEKFGGIKIYRDSFRVRPYGDLGNDWLKLGDRAASSPAGAGQRIGDWKVRPTQIAGIINISRIRNTELVDKSDRGALVENETFELFQNVIVSIIGAFEYDRTKILNPFYLVAKADEEKKRKEEIRKEAEKLADKIVEERRKVEEKVYGRKPDLFREKKENDEKESYKKIIEEGFENVEKNEDKAEIAQVRTLASLGLIVSSFAHELKGIKGIAFDAQDLEKIFIKIIAEEKKKSIDYKDGLSIIHSIKKDTEKAAHWVEYALTSIRRDKRERSSLKFDKYFNGLDKLWSKVLSEGNIKLKVKNSMTKDYLFKAFEMDMNTIFSNLIANSIDSFHNLKQIRDREISIQFNELKNNIIINYSDNGTGIPKVFSKNKEEIFLPFTTSKKDKDGNPIGTGIGMYLVKNVIEDNNGSYELLDSNIGFKLKIKFPVKIKK